MGEGGGAPPPSVGPSSCGANPMCRPLLLLVTGKDKEPSPCLLVGVVGEASLRPPACRPSPRGASRPPSGSRPLIGEASLPPPACRPYLPPAAAKDEGDPPRRSREAPASRSRPTSRLLWLAHAATPQGKLILDAGAVKAICERGTSLLPAGVTAVEGTFIAGDTVELVGPDGKVIARGLVAFDAVELPVMLGRSTKELAAALGPEYERELVHRDDLVLL